ncbi:MAG: Hsp70 family protein [Sulfurimicrobium sp.]|nr:Hsp70 family protein [Sulfurimicrobium sp.]
MSTIPNEAVVAWGIDLGTTNSTLCRTTLPTGATSATEPELVSLRQPTPAGEFTGTLLPSIVATYQGREFVGQGAKDLRALMADTSKGIARNVNLFHDCKNEIGTSRTYPNAPEGYRSPTDIAARILGYLRREGIGETAPGQVVVTVPASFQTAQRAETARACARAGLDVSGGRLLDEPVAAFIDFAYRHDPGLLESVTGKKNLLVFDFGGGTCDIALFELNRTTAATPVQVASRSVSRFHRLGGGDIDLAILHKVLVPQLCKENGLTEFDLSFQEKAKVITPGLIAVAEALKIQICNEIWRLQQFGKLESTPRADIGARYPAQVSMRQGERTLKLSTASISAAQFDDVLAPFLNTEHLFARSTEYRLENSIFAPIADALDRARLESGEIDFVLAVGGSSLIPQVMDALRGYFPRARMLQYEDRKDAQLAVARGASLQALALATSGRGVIAPVVQDDIYLVTQSGDLRLVTQSVTLPFPAAGVSVNDSLSVPADAFEQPLRLSVELVAGSERRPLFRDHWDMTMVRKGSPLRLEYAYDENQVFHLELKQTNFPESVAFKASIENPLSHVVNPNQQQEEIDRLEEEYRQDNRKAEQLMPRIAELCADLGQHDKAIGLVRTLLRQANRPVAWLLNRQAMYEDARGNQPVAIRGYEEAGKVSRDWGGPFFNLALLHEKQREYDAALRAIDRCIQLQDLPPYQTLKLRIRKHLNANVETLASAALILKDFGDPVDLDDWELGWFIAASDLAGDQHASEAGRKIRQSRKGAGPVDSGGLRPEMSGKRE